MGAPPDSADNDVQANVVATGYGTLTREELLHRQ